MPIKTKFEAGQAVKHLDGSKYVVKYVEAVSNGVENMRESYGVVQHSDDGSAIGLIWFAVFELTPIEPPPADLDARARELIHACYHLTNSRYMYVNKDGRCSPRPWSGSQQSYVVNADSPKAVAAVRAHLVAQEKGEADVNE